MRVLVLEAGAGDRRRLANVLRDTFTDVEIVEAEAGPVLEPALTATPDEPQSAPAANLAGDIQAAARFPLENPNPVLRVARDGRLLFANRASERFLRAHGMSMNDPLPARWRRAVGDIYAAGRERRFEMAVEDRIFELDVVPIAEAGYLNVYGRDVTEQAQAGAALQQERDLLHTIMEHARAALVYLDFDFNFVAMNSAYELACERSREEMIGRNHFDLFPNVENEAIFRQVRDTGRPVEYIARPFEFTDMPWRGMTYWDWTLTPVKRPDGLVSGLIFSLVDVTERVRAREVLEQRVQKRTEELSSREAALQQANEVLRYQASVLENVNDAIIAYDAGDLRITTWNRRAEEQYGWTAAEALGGYAPAMVGAKLDPEQQAEIERMEAETGRWRGELEHTRRDGTPIAVETTSTVLRDDTGRIVAHVTANRDITERKHMEHALEAQTERLEILHQIDTSILASRSPAEIAQMAVDKIQRTACARRVTVVLCDLATGMGEILATSGLGAQGYLPGNRLPLAEYLDMDELSAGRVVVIEDMLKLPDSVTWKRRGLRDGFRSASLIPMKIEANVIGMLTISRVEPGPLPPEILELARHVTDSLAIAVHNARLNEELVQRQAALEQMNADLRYQALLLENVNDAVFAFDTNLRITAWNRAAEEQYGWRAEEVLGAYAPDVVGSQAGEEERSARLRAITETGRWQGEVTHTRRDGTPIIVEATSMALRDDAGRIYAHVTVNRDITERKRMDQELLSGRERLQSMARRLVELQENERYEVANQLYNDEGQRLAALLIGLGRLKRDVVGPTDPAGAALLTEMIELAEGVLSDIHNLAVNLRPASLDRLGLQAALSQAVTEFGRQSAAKVECDLSALAGLHLSPRVETNTFRIVQEALANIARHASAGCVSLTAVVRDQQLTVILEDDGVGFDFAAMERTGGLGLLAMRERAEAMGGSLTVESTPGRGTILYIEIPQADV